MKTITVKLSPAGIAKAYPSELDGSKKFEFIDDDRIEVKDEYHSMHELYEHRMALNVALFRAWNYLSENFPEYNVFRSKFHYDGTMFDGYFIVMAETPKGQISYHYKLKHWDDFDFLEEVERTPKWDGHTPSKTIKILLQV